MKSIVNVKNVLADKGSLAITYFSLKMNQSLMSL